ncbi:hypothetical protein RN70_09075 [Staphylococcus schleiferi]|uniref:hypothetical protein n=1 Tax=Staphylococcus coagulans TaxID=74706 RepID=UPI00067A1DE8|nr:hypothetical protein [Staphylococcus coagulans]AKS69640.1 hypothetical protein NP71_08815 [Staphylococcus schleiferi]AKS71809.1 hypothetical protein OA96_08390 [Staphylococcus schleiferi]AKS74044.1 hypothetical protein RN70_09075 [Staphylococcus schleiferi]MBA8763764.1 hypothetical protein [Staphylococcus coagulans]MBT2809340.1 hypothetical protein [Staphylococcus coagulans]
MSEKKDENKKGCLGCLGIIVLIILVFGGCSALFGNDEDKQKSDTETQTQKATDEQSKKQDEKKTQQKEKKEAKTSETKKKKITPEDNTVYGKLTRKHNDNNPVVIEDMTYVLSDKDKILQAEKDFSNLPLDKNTDKNFLNEHAKDLMAKDAEFVSNKSDTEQKYHSESLNKDYYVTLSLTDKGKVKSLIVSSFE